MLWFSTIILKSFWPSIGLIGILNSLSSSFDASFDYNHEVIEFNYGLEL